MSYFMSMVSVYVIVMIVHSSVLLTAALLKDSYSLMFFTKHASYILWRQYFQVDSSTGKLEEIDFYLGFFFSFSSVYRPRPICPLIVLVFWLLGHRSRLRKWPNWRHHRTTLCGIFTAVLSARLHVSLCHIFTRTDYKECHKQLNFVVCFTFAHLIFKIGYNNFTQTKTNSDL